MATALDDDTLSYQPLPPEALRRDPGLILDPEECLTGDFLRSLAKVDLALARLEMTWGQRANVDTWLRCAIDAQRCWRGFRMRWYGEVRKDARDQRREALKFMTQAHTVLLKRDPAELKGALELLKFAGRQDNRCGEIWSLRGEVRYALGDFEKARQAFLKSFELLPERRRPVAQLGQARCLASLNEYKKADDLLGLLLEQEIRQRKPADLETAERRFRQSLGETDADEFPAPPPEHPPRTAATRASTRASTRGSRKRRALTAEGSERPTTSYAAKALLVTRRRHAVNRGDAPFAHARFLRGCVRAKLADWRGAEVDFTAYLEAAPPELKIPTKMSPYLPAELDLASHRAQALTLLGVARGCNRHWSGAVARLTEAAQIEPEPRRLCLLGRVHACERQWLLAMDRYRDALNLDASLEMARVGLDQVRIKHEPMPLVTGLI